MRSCAKPRRQTVKNNIRPAMCMTPPTNGPCAGQMVIHLTAHRRRLSDHRLIQIRGGSSGRIHDDRQRRFQRMGKIAGMAARRFRLGFAMRQQLVDFRHQRFHLHRELRFNPPRLAGTDGGNRL